MLRVSLLFFEMDLVLEELFGMILTNKQDKNLFMIFKEFLKEHIFLIGFKRRKWGIQQVENRFEFG